MGAVWGAFGTIFTAIAVAHTLYAPREVVIWNWRRILLLGLSLALAIGSQFSLYPGSHRARIHVVSCAHAAASSIRNLVSCMRSGILSIYSFLFIPSRRFLARHATRHLFRNHLEGIPASATYMRILAQLGQSGPVLLLAIPVTLITYFVWRRPRYFGNTAPLMIASLFLLLGLGTPHYPGFGFQLMAAPFWFVFAAGVAADLLETRHRELVQASVWGLLTANALWNVLELARVGRV